MSNRKFQIERFLNGKNRRNRKTNRNRPTPRAFRQNYGDDSGYVSVNLHDLALHNAKNRIKEELRDAKALPHDAVYESSNALYPLYIQCLHELSIMPEDLYVYIITL